MAERNIDSFNDELKEEVNDIISHLNALFDIVKDMHESIKSSSRIISNLYLENLENCQPFVRITSGLLELNDEFEIVEMKLSLVKDGIRLLRYILESTFENPVHNFFLVKSRLYNILQDVLDKNMANTDRVEDIGLAIQEVLSNPN